MRSIDFDNLHNLAAQVDAMATAITGLGVDKNPTERELFGMWFILNGIAKELNEMSGWGESEDDESKGNEDE